MCCYVLIDFIYIIIDVFKKVPSFQTCRTNIFNPKQYMFPHASGAIRTKVFKNKQTNKYCITQVYNSAHFNEI